MKDFRIRQMILLGKIQQQQQKLVCALQPLTYLPWGIMLSRLITRKVYLRPPPEANCNGLWLLRKTVYGLGDASRKFYLKARKELLNLQCEMSSVDPAVFYWKKNGIVEGVFVTHVDDFYYGGTNRFCEQVVSPLKTIFHLSS